jgi:hypothetical protein
MLGTVYKRTTLYGYHSTVGRNTVEGTYYAGFHVEVDEHLVALLPAALDVDVAVGAYEEGHGDAVD